MFEEGTKIMLTNEALHLIIATSAGKDFSSVKSNDGSLLWEVKRDAFVLALKDSLSGKKHKNYIYTQINYAASELLMH
jgi:hypothetical protein